MTALIVRAEDRAVPELLPAENLMNAIGLTDMLPEILAQDEAGRSYESVQLDPNKQLMELISYALRREPVGGAEALIRENVLEVKQRALAQLNRTLASATTPTRGLLQDALAETQARVSRLEARLQEAERVYARTQERLHRWQERAGQRSGSLGGDMWRWLVGGPERLSLPEAITLWNQREYQALDRSACSGALDLGAWCLETIIDLLTRLDDLLAEARQLRALLDQRSERLRMPTPLFSPWTLRVDAWAVAQALIGRADPRVLVADLLRRQTGGTGALTAHVQAVVQEQAERLLAGMGLPEFVELEAGSSAPDGAEDPLILVGQELLEAVQRPSWQVARAARPHVETLQVTHDGAPIYTLDGLGSAADDGGQDRIGFVQVRVGVAKDDLALARESDEAFQAALQQRNLFVLDELAEQWETHHAQSNGAWHDTPAVI